MKSAIGLFYALAIVLFCIGAQASDTQDKFTTLVKESYVSIGTIFKEGLPTPGGGDFRPSIHCGFTSSGDKLECVTTMCGFFGSNRECADRNKGERFFIAPLDLELQTYIISSYKSGLTLTHFDSYLKTPKPPKMALVMFKE